MPATIHPAKRHKIFWTPEEEAWVASRLWHKGIRADDKGLIAQVKKAQIAGLPSWRQRSIAGAYTVRGVVRLLTEWEKGKTGPGTPQEPLYSPAERGKPLQGKRREEALASKRNSATPREDHVGSSQHSIEAKGMPLQGEPPLLPAPQSRMAGVAGVGAEIGDSLLAELDGALQTLARSLALRFLDHLQAELTTQAEKRLPQIVEAVSPGVLTPKLPKVLILGLLPRQYRLIRQEFGECFNLEFWKDEGAQKLRDMARGAIQIFGMTDFMGHADEQSLKKMPQYQRLGGGMSGLRDALTKLYIAPEAT